MGDYTRVPLSPEISSHAVGGDYVGGFATPGRVDYAGGFSKDGSPHATDEVFNAASHLAGAMLSVLGLVVLVAKSAVEATPWHIVSFSIYGTSLICLFSASFLHHGLHVPKYDKYLKMADYLFIYILIAGTFTPLCLALFHHCWVGWVFFGVCWGFATFGIIAQTALEVPKWFSLTVYAFMGACGFFYAYPVWMRIGISGVSILAGGGLLYYAGTVIFIYEAPNPLPGSFGFHELWHLFVLSGAFSHWCVMFFFVLPYVGDGGCPGI